MFNFITKPAFPRGLKYMRLLSTGLSVQEVAIPVPWGEIRGKWWGPTNKIPVLTLHGWQDNCGSFDRLIPLLNKDLGYLAVDFPGHGYSSPLPAGMFYNTTVYLLTVEHLRRYFKWPRVSLLGHSLGGFTNFMYSMIYPDNVEFVACLDIHLPPLLKNQLNWLEKVLEQFWKNNDFFMSHQEPPSYTIQEIKKKIHAPVNGSISEQCAELLMKRSIAPSELHKGKYYFTRDPRLKSIEMYAFTMEELLENAKRIKSPIFLAKAELSTTIRHNEQFYDVLQVLKDSSREVDFHVVEGTHHVHLNNPEELAVLLNKFIERNDSGDRTMNEIPRKIVVTDDQDPRLKDSFA